MARHAPADLDGLALVEVVDRPGQRDLLAVVAERASDGEAALVGAVQRTATISARGRRVPAPAEGTLRSRPITEERRAHGLHGQGEEARRAGAAARPRTAPLKERAKALADQAQAKLDEVQGAVHRRPGSHGAPPPRRAAGRAWQPGARGRRRRLRGRRADRAGGPPRAEAAGRRAVEPARARRRASADAVDRSDEAPPKLTGGDPLARLILGQWVAVAGLGAILTAIVTPFDDELRVDEEAFVALMHHLADHGSDGFVVCGTTGEASTLDRRGAPRRDRARRRRSGRRARRSSPASAPTTRATPST